MPRQHTDDLNAGRIRILFVNRFFHPDHSATSQLVSDLAFHLASDVSVTAIASATLYDDHGRRLPNRERVNGVEVVRVAPARFGRSGLVGRALDLLRFHLAAFFALIHLARRGDVIVAKTDPPLLSVTCAVAAWLKRARLVNWWQDVYPETASALGVRLLGATSFLRAARDVSARVAEFNVALGEIMAGRLRESGLAAERISVIGNWVDEQSILPVAEADNPLRRAWGLEGRFVVGYSGNLGRAHEFETMLGAARILADDPRIVFLVIGGGQLTGALKSAAASLSNLVFQPYQPADKLAIALGAADVHWLSLRPELEGLIVPSKVYGVLAAGRPVIAVTHPSGEIAALAAAHGFGVQVDPGDSEAFARVVMDLAGDPVLQARLGSAARSAAEGPFARARALARWRAVLDAAAR